MQDDSATAVDTTDAAPLDSIESAPVVHKDSLTERTLKTELMQVVLEELRAANGVWAKLTEDQQEYVIDRIDRRVSTMIKRTLAVFATSGIARVSATLDQVTIKDGIKGVISLSRHDEQRHQVMDAQGQTVYLVLANPEQFTDAPHGHEADSIQADLDLSGGDQAPDADAGDADTASADEEASGDAEQAQEA